jgi:sulfide:quinone oxidoreductase
MAHTVVVLGSGVGGLVAAHRLRRRLPKSDRVVLVDRDTEYRYAPSYLWVLDGSRTPQRLTRPLARLRRHGIDLHIAEVTGIDVDKRQADTTSGVLGYDRLVIALGAQLAPETVPGFAEGAHDLYRLDGATAGRGALHQLTGGRVAVVLSRAPYKCPAAPWEAALLTEALLRRRGIRDRCEVDVYTPEPLPMPTAGPQIGQAVVDLLTQRGIGFHPAHHLDHIDPDQHRLAFAGTEADYDLLLGVPAHQAPTVIRDSSLAGPTGYIPVDPATLATSIDGVYAIGDVTAIPIAAGKSLPKAGVFAYAEADIVARRIADELVGRTPTATFDGAGACFLETGDGRAGYATGNFYATNGPTLRLRPPARRWHLAKTALERYWLTRWWW